MVNRDPEKCSCQGSGTYYTYLAQEMTPWMKDQYDPNEDLKIPYEENLCVWHSKDPAARAHIKYPDGWPEEDLRQWCKEKNVPEPEWLPRPRLKRKEWGADTEISGQILFSGTITIPFKYKTLHGFVSADFPAYPSAPYEELGPEGVKPEDFDPADETVFILDTEIGNKSTE